MRGIKPKVVEIFVDTPEMNAALRDHVSRDSGAYEYSFRATQTEIQIKNLAPVDSGIIDSLKNLAGSIGATSRLRDVDRQNWIIIVDVPQHGDLESEKKFSTFLKQLYAIYQNAGWEVRAREDEKHYCSWYG
jgi:hypothetical protein